MEGVERIERRAERLVGASFLVLAAYVAFEAIRALVTAEAPDASPIGIELTTVSIAVMLWLARAKRQAGEALGSRALVADAQQTYACCYLFDHRPGRSRAQRLLRAVVGRPGRGARHRRPPRPRGLGGLERRG